VVAAICALLVAAAAAGADAQSWDPAGTRFTLSGVVVVEGGGRAWLQEPTLTQNQTVAVRPGDSIGPYRLTKILEDRVELEGPGGKFSVMLAGVASPVAAAPPVVAAPVAVAQPTVAPSDPDRVVVFPPMPPLGPVPPGPGVDLGSLLRGNVAR
jgi:hypothetical protein